jgi:hypothetical protein
VKSTDHEAPHYAVFSITLSLALLTPKYIPQHPVPNHAQPMLFPQCDRPSFTQVKKVRQEYSSGHSSRRILAHWKASAREPKATKHSERIPSLTSFMDALIFSGRQEIEEFRGPVFDVEMFRR